MLIVGWLGSERGMRSHSDSLLWARSLRSTQENRANNSQALNGTHTAASALIRFQRHRAGGQRRPAGPPRARRSRSHFWAHLAADSFTPLVTALERARREHRPRSAWTDDPGTTLIVSGSMSLIFVQAAAQRIEASFTRKLLPYSSVRAFPRHRLPAAAGRCCDSTWLDV